MPARHRGHRGRGHGPLTPSTRLLWAAVALLGWGGAVPASRAQDDSGAASAGDDPPRPRLVDQVTVTATRSQTRVGEIPASVAVLDQEALEVTAAPTIDDALRQVVGFSLFRRAGSRTANPTVQGVSLRGLGASGASRALVLMDGLPLNDPFGGWVYWGRVPRLGVERLEVLRGGASDLYGSGALGGVAQVLTPPLGPGRALRAEASAGGAGSFDGAASAHAAKGPWGVRLSAQGLHTDGHLAVDEGERGPVDRPVASRHLALDSTVERQLGGDGRVFVRATYYDEARENGTPLQENDTGIGLLAAGLDRGPWTWRLWGSTQELRQAFSAVASDRTTERLTRRQRVPADAVGLSGQWSRALGGRHHLVAGIEARRVSGSALETGYRDGAATTELDAGGTQLGAAAFVEERFQAHPRWLLTATGRLDVWAQREGHSFLTPLTPEVPASDSTFPDRTEAALSPRLGLLFRAGSGLSLTGSAYGAFRGPTLNELYRGFRVGDTVTRPNAALGPERLWGGEVGALLARGPLALRLTVFDAEVRDAVANVTTETTPFLVTRQRQNLGRARSTGLEVEGEARLGNRGTVTAGYTLLDSRVTSFAADPSLEGRQLPHVPRHQAVLQVRYESTWRLGLQGRWIGDAWEDDRNTLALRSALVLDLFVARRVAHGLEVFAAAENLLDTDVVVGRTPVRTLGPPRLIRGGLRFRAGR